MRVWNAGSKGRGDRCGGREARRPADAHGSYAPCCADGACTDIDHNTRLSLVHHSYPIAYLPPRGNFPPKKPRREESSYVHVRQRSETTHNLSQGSAPC